MRSALRTARDTARFRLWATRLDLALRRSGVRLRLSAPHGARWERAPWIRVVGVADRPTTFELSIGAGVRFERDTVIEVKAAADNRLAIGDASIVYDRTTLQLHGGMIELADHVQLRRDTLLKSSGLLSIGSRTQLSHGAIVHCAQRVDIAPCVGIAERVTIADSDHLLDGTDEHWMGRPLKVGAIHIGRNVFVGTGSLVLRGAQIDRNAVVAAVSVVSAGEYASGWLYAGAPARPVRELQPVPAAS